MSEYFPKPFRSFGGNINVKVDLSNYATKADLKNVTQADSSSFALKTNLANLKTEGKIPSIIGLATTSALTAVENKIPSNSNLVKKTDYQRKTTEIENKLTDHNHNKYITTPEFNKLTAENFSARLAQANLITKTEFNSKLSSLNRKIVSNKTKHLLIKNKLKKLKHLI